MMSHDARRNRPSLAPGFAAFGLFVSLPQSVRADDSVALDTVQVTATRSEGRRFDDAANTVPLGGYTTLDLRADGAFARDWHFEARLGNVFDKRYETAAFYNRAGRTVMFMLRRQGL